MTSAIDRVLTYWFGEDPDDPKIIGRRGTFWFVGGEHRESIDAQIRTQFSEDYDRACRGELASWAEAPRGRLALIILLDQFSRNLYRDDLRAFATDGLSLSLTLEGIERSHDKELRLAERIFFYMPLKHAESRALQTKSVELYGQLVDLAPERMKPGFARIFEKAQEHQRCIELFGRYPHRNKVLGRKTTPEEQHFLDNEPQPGRGAAGPPAAHLVKA